MPDLSVDIQGTPEEVQAMIDVSHKVEPSCYQKKKIGPGHYKLWYRGDAGSQNDFVQAMRRKAGLVKSKPRRERTPKQDSAPVEDVTE